MKRNYSYIEISCKINNRKMFFPFVFLMNCAVTHSRLSVWIWTLLCLLSGHHIQLISDLSTGSGGVTILLRERRPSPVPHGSLKLKFWRMLFPPWTKHITALFCGKNPGMWVTAWVGSCPVLIADLTLSERYSQAILYRSREKWRGPGSERKHCSF